ncbi:hypothetical protein L210DRAFT_3371946, partial [Boletus edulis BED1]
FIKSADKLFGPITTLRHPGQPVRHIPWTAFTINATDWECVNAVRIIVSNANNIQHLFSQNNHPSLWHAIPAFEDLLTTWEEKCALDKYVPYRQAIECGLDKLKKYYHKFDQKDVYILVLVLHPYYKLTYIKMAWGGLDEQRKEIAAGNPHTRDWHDDALKVVEKMMQDYW